MKENLILTALCLIIGYVAIVIFKVNNKGFTFRNKPDFKKKKQSKQTLNAEFFKLLGITGIDSISSYNFQASHVVAINK